jgi:hypothetical protein
MKLKLEADSLLCIRLFQTPPWERELRSLICQFRRSCAVSNMVCLQAERVLAVIFGKEITNRTPTGNKI